VMTDRIGKQRALPRCSAARSGLAVEHVHRHRDLNPTRPAHRHQACQADPHPAAAPTASHTPSRRPIHGTGGTRRYPRPRVNPAAVNWQTLLG
jgi:hypothetical protein